MTLISNKKLFYKKLQNTCFVICFLFALNATAQPAVYHTGNMQFHDGAQVGFHTDFINDAPFDQNLGLAGFYSPDYMYIYGTVTPVFYDLEINTDYSVSLNVPVLVSNNLNFAYGNISTPRSQNNIYLGLLTGAQYGGESNFSKIDGYSLITNQQLNSFPVGDEILLRPLILNSTDINLTAKCAYFFENPNSSASFTEIFDTSKTARQLDIVNTKEFWRVEGSVLSTITIGWNERSNISALTDVLENLLVVGWSKANKEWEILGNNAVSGDLLNGVITSINFMPDDYEVVTIGSLLVPQDRLTIPNFYLSPNGDGINDALVIEELELSSQNEVKIYDRQGSLVFQKENYTNEFTGISNSDNFVIKRGAGLPGGIYFYIVNMYDLGYEFQGFLYLAQQ